MNCRPIAKILHFTINAKIRWYNAMTYSDLLKVYLQQEHQEVFCSAKKIHKNLYAWILQTIAMIMNDFHVSDFYLPNFHTIFVSTQLTWSKSPKTLVIPAISERYTMVDQKGATHLNISHLTLSANGHFVCKTILYPLNKTFRKIIFEKKKLFGEMQRRTKIFLLL